VRYKDWDVDRSSMQPLRELTDDEIALLWGDDISGRTEIVQEFARAVIKAAKEKL